MTDSRAQQPTRKSIQKFTSLPAAQRSRFAAAYRVLEEAIAARAFPGCAFGVLAGGEMVLLDGLGRFTYEDNTSAVMPHTIYDIASVTKVVGTTAVAMRLCQSGHFDLDTPLGEVLPAFILGRDPGERRRHVRLRHLLAHSSGLPGYVELFRTATTPAALLHACLELPLEAEPGTRAEYSDPGFILLGKALEVIAHERLAHLVRREVLHPLGLRSTGFRPPHSARPFIPPSEEDATFRHRRIQGEVQDENAYVLQGVAGHAGLFSNVPDLLRFAGAILRPGTTPPTTARHFDPQVIEQFARRQGPEGSSCALGWDTPSEISSAGRHFSAHSIGHLGYSGCSLWIDLDAAVAVVLLTNRTWPDRKSQLIREVRPAFHNAIREAL
ncbi:MAG TPA: serine hydrolase domain-containing protein [Terracidiphilus sp.]|nr:serine hydrolase domain-containing protein [Terracidiphilus sp.]